MHFGLDAEQLAIRDTVRSFVENEVMPLEQEVLQRERAGEPEISTEELHDLQERARMSGLWGIDVPESLGGAALDAVTQAVIQMELHRTFVPFQFGGHVDNILYACVGEQVERYLLPSISGERVGCFALTEPGAGSDAKAIGMRARRDGDDWVIDGEKTFISRGSQADYALVFAVTDPDKDPDHGISCLLVDRDAGWTSTPIPTMSSWEPASLSFEGVRVPGSAVLGEVGRGFDLAMQWISRGRWVVPACAVGAAERLLQMAVDHAKVRETFGQPLAERQAIQWMIADSAAELEATRLLTLKAAWLSDQGIDARHSASIAKLNGAAMANAVVDRVLQIHGGMGYSRELPIQRWYRELRVLRIFEGSDEIQRMTIARNILRGHASIQITGNDRKTSRKAAL